MLPLLRFTLDLFDPRPSRPQGEAPQGQAGARQPASAPPPQARPARPDGGQPPWVHPKASRRIRLGAHEVAYAFTHARRRSIGMFVDLDGLSVRSPRWVSKRAVEEALLERAAWIVRKLQDSQLRLEQQAERALVWQDGMSLPYLGASLAVRCDAQAARPMRQWLESDAGPVLRLGLPLDASAEQLQVQVRLALQAQARVVFEQRLNHFAPLLGVRWTRLLLSQARTRWGSVNSDGVVRLNWRLMHLPMAVLDYVVVHELSHLRDMSHGPAFWAIVASVLPDYKQRQRGLKDDALTLWPSA